MRPGPYYGGVPVPRRPTSRLGRLTWRLRSPWAVVACALLLLGLGSLGRESGGWEDRRLRYRFSDYTVFAFRDGEGGSIEIIDPDSESWDRLSRLISTRTVDVLRLDFREVYQVVCIPFPVAIKCERTVRSKFLGSEHPWTAEERAQARVLLVRWLGEQHSERAESVRSGDYKSWEPVFWGMGLNLVVLLFMLALPAMVIGMPRYLRVNYAERRLRQGRCGLCRYDLRSTHTSFEGIRCPECGAVWPDPLTTRL
jgi:hypothetical protein